MLLAWVYAWFPQSFAGFAHIVSFAEGLGFLQICLGGLPSFPSQQKLEKSSVASNLMSFFVGYITGARKRGNFATVLREPSRLP